ncbi:MAG: GGDEF domain-containing protein [Dermatophilaceae bacterium]
MTVQSQTGGLMDEQSDDRDRALRSGEPSGISAGLDTFAVEAMLEATRGLLWISTAGDAAVLAAELIVALGGTTASATAGPGNDAIPVDVSFGEGPPLLPVAPPLSVARMLLERYLPGFVRDAQRAVELAEQTSRLAEDASIDALTGLANRRFLGRALGRLRPQDTVVMIDLDHFKAVNDKLGHSEGDRVLRALGRTLSSTLRVTDQAGRYGGEEFVVIIPDVGAEAFLTRLQLAWVAARPYPITFSAGIAPAAVDPARALDAADKAMYRAKEGGRDQWQWATPQDYR